MKKTNTRYPKRPTAQRFALSISPLAAACSTILMAASGAAHAQQQAAAGNDVLEEVIVSGIRKSIQDAVAAKKADSSMIEAISAEDIGKLPDASIAESIGRLPGLAAQRTNGRAQTLSIRGLGPDFTITTLNGREQASINDNRTVEFDQFPSELVSQVKVFKTPNASMVYQGIAGTADIETVRPLAYGSAARSISYQRDQDNLKAQVPGQTTGGDRASLFYIDQFMDNTVGVAFGAAWNKTPYQTTTREPWGYPNNYGATTPTSQGIPAGDEVIGGDKDGVKSAFYERTAFMGVFEYKPNESLHMVVDAYHSKFEELQTIRRMEYGTIWAGADLSTVGSVVNNRVDSGTFTNIPFLVAENYNNLRHATLNALGWNTDLKVGDQWDLNADLSWSQDKRTDLRLESTAGLGRNGDPNLQPPPETATFTTQSSGVTNFTTTHDYSNYNTTFLTDPGNWGGGPTRSGYLGFPTVNDDIMAVKLAAMRKLSGGLFSDFSVGVNFADRTKSKYQWQSILYLPNGLSHSVVPTAFRNGIVNTSFFGNPFGMINYDAYGLYNSGFWKTVDSRVDPNANSGDTYADFTNTWKVREKLTTTYVKFDIDTQFLGRPLTGNIGVQTATADQKSDIFVSPSGSAANGSVVTLGDRYTHVLPSLNLSLGLPDDTFLRAAAAVTEARPRMDDMAGGASYTTIADSQPPLHTTDGRAVYWTQNGGGNPKLKPWKADAFDLSLEKYFDNNKGYVSAAVFYKKLLSYIYPRLSLIDFTGVPLPSNAGLTYVNADKNRLGYGSVASNGEGGSIKGVELSASLPFELLAAPLQGFGLIASASFNRSHVNPYGQDVEIPGLSPKVINTTLYYERGGFSVRVSDRYRGGFVGEVPAYDSSLSFNYVKSESILDAQIGYTWESGALKGLSLNLSGSNLTDAPFVLTNVGAPSSDIIKYEKYGPVYAFLARYKF